MHEARLSLAAVLCAGLAGLATPALAQKPAALSEDVKRFVAVDAPRVVLSHVRVIDGKGNPAAEDRNVVVEDGRIHSVGPGADVAEAPGQRVLDLKGHTVLPGLVGMHNHLYHIAQEALTNALRHASARRIVIELGQDVHGLRLAVLDDGCGIAPARAHQGLGLRIMQYRARAAGGELRIGPRDPQGTRVEFRATSPDIAVTH